MQHSHCSYCGAGYPPDAPWPRTCARCGATTWRNPLPVAVALQPVTGPAGTGLVLIRRDIEPARGGLALPGGYLELGETWQDAVVRELFEETRIEATAADVTLFDVHSAAHAINIFGLLPARDFADLPPSAPTAEATEWLVTARPLPLPFSTHARALRDYFAAPA